MITTKHSRFAAGTAFAAVLLISGTPAFAQSADYPSDRITLTVGFAAGGFADTYARILGDELGKKWKTVVTVENTAGAGGNTAASFIANQEPDGYNILVTTTAIAINPTLYKSLDYKLDDLTGIAVPVSSPETIATHPSQPGTLKAFLEAHQGKEITFATAGVGSGSHIAAEYFLKVIAKVNAAHVPFRGGALSVQAALGNQVNMVASSFGVTPQVVEKALTGLAVASAERNPTMPDVPTYAEGGYPFIAESWVGLFAPSKTPPEVVEKLNGAINEIMSEPEVQKKLSDMGYQLHIRTVPEVAAYVKEEGAKWGEMVKAIGVTVE